MKRESDQTKSPALRYRFENFGGIVSSQNPPFLASVDRQFMREMGYGNSPLWEGASEEIGTLSAPTEAHFACTNACDARCPHCYMGAGSRDAGEMDTETFKRALKNLAEMGVFHVALGGGEALLRPDLFEIAEFAREAGLVPNLTVSGASLTDEQARRMGVFGQVNISMDGVGELYGTFRRAELFAGAVAAIDRLTEAGVPTGVNCVVGRRNFEGIPDLFRFAEEKGLNEIEFLRLKPAGRGKERFLEECATAEQNLALVPTLTDLFERTGVTAKIDCSFVPMLCAHEPPRGMLEALATYGCEAGNVLVGIRSDGAVSGCSFLESEGLGVFDLRKAWKDNAHFQKARTWPERAKEPCRSCQYLSICKGGCHAVSAFLTGDFDAPDPHCPIVVSLECVGLPPL